MLLNTPSHKVHDYIAFQSKINMSICSHSYSKPPFVFQIVLKIWFHNTLLLYILSTYDVNIYFATYLSIYF